MRFILLFLFAFSFQSHSDCFPKVDFQIQESASSGITKAQYMRMLDVAERTYGPVFQRWGCPLILHRSWSNGTVNAQAWRDWNGCHVEIFGGIARYPGMSQAAVLQVTMHEIGHHLGGAPYYSGESMSVEGQADYYSTWIGMKAAGVGSVASSLSLARSLARMAGEASPWRPGPQLPEVGRTYESHPAAQCRLQTFDAARGGGARPRCWFAP